MRTGVCWPRSSGHQQNESPTMGDRSGPNAATSMTPGGWRLARRRSSLAGSAILWVFGAVLSYNALLELAHMLGYQDPWAYGVPVVVDVACWTGSMNGLEACEQGRQ